MTSILRYWQLILALVGMLATGYAVHRTETALADERQASAIVSQRKVDTSLCEQQKSTTKEANDALTKSRDDIAARLNALQLQTPSRCVPVSSTTKLSSGGKQHAGSHGVSAGWLRRYAATAEGYREELSTCIDFTAKASTVNK